ncbi:MAG: NUDIX hydrolase [Candidatus Latescibacterota bacterium]
MKHEDISFEEEIPELFDILDDDGNVIGQATRLECHSGSYLLHPVVHVLVFTSEGGLYLQKRSNRKDIQPGKWDASVGGHVSSGEALEHAVSREAEEELGIRGTDFERLYSYIMTSDIERELVATFRCTWDLPVHFPREEIDEVRVFTPGEVESLLGSGRFTPNFEEEWGRYKKFTARNLT